jgi:benzoate-CoA ligase
MWVAPAEVENRLLAHPSVAQAVVVAAPDADELDKPVAFVVPAASSEPSEEELIAFCREGMESYKRPRRVVFVSGYPTTATGKIRRVELRATAAEVLGR